MPETAPTAGAGASSDETVDAAALPADVWRIIARFARTVSAVATRHLAAPARTLDEHVQYKLDSNKDEWHDRTHAQNEVDRTKHCLKLLNALRTVSTELRDIVNYSSTRELALKSDACLKMPTDFATRFGGCETLTIDGFGDRDNYVHRYTPREGARSVDSLPEELQQLPRLRSLSLHAMATGLTPWFRDLNLRELYIDYPDGVSQRSWERDPHVLPRTLEVLLFNTCVEDASLECVRLLPRLREIRLGSRNLTQSDDVPHWFHELTSLRRFEVYLASVGDWAEELSAMSLGGTRCAVMTGGTQCSDLRIRRRQMTPAPESCPPRARDSKNVYFTNNYHTRAGTSVRSSATRASRSGTATVATGNGRSGRVRTPPPLLSNDLLPA